uniref:Piezo-type mechanosensitive ion channel component 2-like n=1 Tax=Petromyzon marinus TaxID=7757 RepID=A0AAJ7WKR8_PETMA|nr:piezo-type mechanosensitive ion channel component 2-like [Petromyzon marinus]
MQHNSVLQRVVNALRFTLALLLALLDSFVTWLDSVSREYIDISAVLMIERYLLAKELKKVWVWCQRRVRERVRERV